MTLLALAHMAATTAMVGIIWMVHLVHYPLMANTGPAHSASYQQLHMRKMSVLVIPVMLVEVATAAALWLSDPTHLSLVGMVTLAAIWVVTALSSVPAHAELLNGFNPGAHRRLMSSNAIRTALWSCRGAIATLLVVA